MLQCRSATVLSSWLRRQKSKKAATKKPETVLSGQKLVPIKAHHNGEGYAEGCQIHPGSTSDVSNQVLPCDLSCDNGASQTVDESQLDLTLCHQSPKLIIAESELSPTDVSSPVFYLEKNDISGVCVD